VTEFTLERDITVFFVTAKSFPMGIKEAFDELNVKLNGSRKRTYFGISNPEPGIGIVYKACAEQLKDEESSGTHLPTIAIKAGKYHCIEIKNFHEDLSSIGKAFEEILKQPDIDHESFCLEIYNDDDGSVKCMVRKK
jgi:hypothetical protein